MRQLAPGHRFELVADRADLSFVEAFDQDPEQRLGARVADEDPAAPLESLLGLPRRILQLRKLLERHAARGADVAERLRDLLQRRELREADAGLREQTCDGQA